MSHLLRRKNENGSLHKREPSLCRIGMSLISKSVYYRIFIIQ